MLFKGEKKKAAVILRVKFMYWNHNSHTALQELAEDKADILKPTIWKTWHEPEALGQASLKLPYPSMASC